MTIRVERVGPYTYLVVGADRFLMTSYDRQRLKMELEHTPEEEERVRQEHRKRMAERDARHEPECPGRSKYKGICSCGAETLIEMIARGVASEQLGRD